MTTKVLHKATGADEILKQVKLLVAKMTEQAAGPEKQIDEALLNQVSGMLDVQTDTAETPSDMASTPGAPSEAPSMPAPSAPSASTPSIPQPMASEAKSPSPSVPSGIPPEIKKADEPMSTRYPVPNLFLNNTDELDRKLGDFVHLMADNGDIKKAKQLAGNQMDFDTLLNKAQHAILDQGGINFANLRKGMSYNSAGVTPEMLYDNNVLAKAIAGGDLPGVFLIKLAKLMLPVYAGMVRRTPVEPPHPASNQALWRVQSGFGTYNFGTGMSTVEAAIGQTAPNNWLNFAAPYFETPVNDTVNLKAIYTSKGYDDPMQVAVIRAMALILQQHEYNHLLGNSAAIGAPASITATPAVTGGTLAANTYYFAVTALTERGLLLASKGTVSAVPAPGETNAAVSTVTTTTATNVNSVVLTWPVVPGAVAYNVYATAAGGTASAVKYLATVYPNTYTVKSVASIVTANTPNVSDQTANATGYEGLLSWCELSTVYTQAITNKVTVVDNAGAGLTAANGGISQIDAVLTNLWTNQKIAPTAMVMSPNMAGSVKGKLVSLGVNTGLIHMMDDSANRGRIEGGSFVSSYVNNFAPFGENLPNIVEIIPHPVMPDGTILFLCESIPYPTGREARGFSRDVLFPYTYFPLASNTAVYNFMLTYAETVECYHPAAQTAIQGIDYTL